MEIDVRDEIETFRFADGEPGENNVCVYDGYLVVNGDGRQEVEIHAEDIDNLIEALKRAKDTHLVSVTSKEEAKKYGRYSPGIDTIYFDNEIYPWTVEATSGEFSDWIKHDGGICPVHPLDMIEDIFEGGTREGPYKAEEIGWPVVTHFRHYKDEDGVPYVSNEGLEPWAEYVATDERNGVFQFAAKPYMQSNIWYVSIDYRLTFAPEKFTNTFQHWTETLRRVWRK